MAVFLFWPPSPSVLKPDPVRLRGLWTGSHEGYRIPGSQLAFFKKILPEKGTLSFIAEAPVENNQAIEKLYYDFENYLAPLVLNARPGEPQALVYCPSEEVADRRLEETGYVWLMRVSGGKGLARKVR